MAVSERAAEGLRRLSYAIVAYDTDRTLPERIAELAHRTARRWRRGRACAQGPLDERYQPPSDLGRPRVGKQVGPNG